MTKEIDEIPKSPEMIAEPEPPAAENQNQETEQQPERIVIIEKCKLDESSSSMSKDKKDTSCNKRADKNPDDGDNEDSCNLSQAATEQFKLTKFTVPHYFKRSHVTVNDNSNEVDQVVKTEERTEEEFLGYKEKTRQQTAMNADEKLKDFKKNYKMLSKQGKVSTLS